MAISRKMMPVAVMRPNFDAGLVAEAYGVEQLDLTTARRAKQWWEMFLPELRVRRFEAGDRGLVLAWLSDKPEKASEAVFHESPTAGLLATAVGSGLVRAAVGRLIPEARTFGCTPLPEPGEEVAEACAQAGLRLNPTGALDSRFALLTFEPWAGGCGVCFLSQGCPRRKFVDPDPKDGSA